MARILRGQKRIWYLLRLVGRDSDVSLRATDKPEFDAWRWNEYWVPLDVVIEFRRGSISRPSTSWCAFLIPTVVIVIAERTETHCKNLTQSRSEGRSTRLRRRNKWLMRTSGSGQCGSRQVPVITSRLLFAPAGGRRFAGPGGHDRPAPGSRRDHRSGNPLTSPTRR